MAKQPKQMNGDTFAKKLEMLVRDANDFQELLSPDRIRAVNYYNGKMDDLPSREGWSSAVSRDVRSVMSKALPSTMRTILGSDRVVEFEPVGQNDENAAKQSTDYMNQYVLAESGATDAIYDACFDAYLLRNGILHWFVDDKTRIEGSEHRDLNEMALTELVSGDDVEILEQSTRIEMQYPDQALVEQAQMQGVPAPQPEPMELYSVKIKRTIKDRKPRLTSVPLDEFLISSDAICIEEARLVGQRRRVSRSDLVAMGYDRKMVDEIEIATENVYSESERYSRRRYQSDETKRIEEQENEKVDYFDLYVRLDYDNDGISELRHVCVAGDIKSGNILINDYANEAPYADVVSERNPHQWEGVSIADDVIEIQRVKTALLRDGLDNIYWQNKRQPIVNADAVENPESIMRPEFGRPILLKRGVNVRDAVAFSEVPFIADNIYEMMQYWDGERTDRTGIDDTSAGLPGDALQNVTAKASAMIEQSGIARVEMLVRTIANSLKRAFRGLLRMVIENNDKARTIRLRDEWVEIDPRSWNADMDAKVNTGLGAGTRERDMMVMQGIMGIQEKLLAGFGPDNPFVTPDNVFAAVSGLVEASGLRTPDKYFTKPDPAKIQAMMEAKANEKPIEIQKIEAQASADQAAKQAELPFEIEKARLETEAAAEKERAQSQAAVDEAIAIADIEAANKAEELALKRYEIDQKIAIEREKLAFDRENAEAQRKSDVDKVRAGSIGKEVAGLNDMANKPAKDAGPVLLELIQKMSEPKKARAVKIIRDENGDMVGAQEEESA